MTQTDHTLLALQQLKVDCLYNKGTHFNAARRLKTHADRFHWALVIGTVAASFSTIMNVGVWDKVPGNTFWLQLIVNVLGALGGFLILYTTAFSDYRSKIDIANKHENIASDLNLIFKKIRNTEAAYKDGLLPVEKLLDQLNTLTEDYISKCANAPITNDEDYLKARDNVEQGYSTEYTEKELKA